MNINNNYLKTLYYFNIFGAYRRHYSFLRNIVARLKIQFKKLYNFHDSISFPKKLKKLFWLEVSQSEILTVGCREYSCISSSRSVLRRLPLGHICQRCDTKGILDWWANEVQERLQIQNRVWGIADGDGTIAGLRQWWMGPHQSYQVIRTHTYYSSGKLVYVNRLYLYIFIDYIYIYFTQNPKSECGFSSRSILLSYALSFENLSLRKR